MAQYGTFFDVTTSRLKRIAQVVFDAASQVLSVPHVSISPQPTATGELRFKELTEAGDHYVGFRSPQVLPDNQIWVLPTQDGTAGQFLKSDGNGNLSFENVTVASITIKTYDLDVTNPAGQTVFTAGEELTGKNFHVYHQGVLKRATEFTQSGTDITFSYTIPQNHWISITVSNSAVLGRDFDVTNPAGQTIFDMEVDLYGKSVQTYHQGVMRRLGAAKDYTIDGTRVVFNDSIAQGAWIRIEVF